MNISNVQYSCYLCIPCTYYPQMEYGISKIDCFLSLHNIIILCNWDLFIFAFSWFTRFTYLKCLFRNVYLKRFPTRNLSKTFPMFYPVVNVSELQLFGSFHFQEHLLMTVSDKNICDKQFVLLVFPRNLLTFFFGRIISESAGKRGLMFLEIYGGDTRIVSLALF